MTTVKDDGFIYSNKIMRTLFAITFLIVSLGWAQTGTIQGIIIDKDAQFPLLGATVKLVNSSYPKGAITDTDGFFQIKDVPLGRQTLKISFVGFETQYRDNIIVDSGKTAVVNIALIESFYRSDLNFFDKKNRDV